MSCILRDCDLSKPLEVELRYAVCFGRGDSSDRVDWTVSISGREKEAYLKAKLMHLPFADFPELWDVLESARGDIAAEELANAVDMDDDFVMECLGRRPVDEEEINALVKARDRHALEFFGLNDCSDEELEDWDAWLEDMPDACDFYEHFEETDPFEEGWELIIEFAETPEEEEVHEEQAAQSVEFYLDNGDIEGLKKYLSRAGFDYAGEEDLHGLVLRVAEENGMGIKAEEIFGK